MNRIARDEIYSTHRSTIDNRIATFHDTRTATQTASLSTLGRPSAMCKCELNRYACGHEDKRGYINCATGQPMADSRDSCGVVHFTPGYTEGPCTTAGCNYQEVIKKGWKCCQCKKGPNREPKCDNDLKPFSWKFYECGHRRCLACDVWEDKKDKKGKGKETGGGGSGSGSGGGGAASKDALQNNLKLVASGISKGSSVGM